MAPCSMNRNSERPPKTIADKHSLSRHGVTAGSSIKSNNVQIPYQTIRSYRICTTTLMTQIPYSWRSSDL